MELPLVLLIELITFKLLFRHQVSCISSANVTLAGEGKLLYALMFEDVVGWKGSELLGVGIVVVQVKPLLSGVPHLFNKLVRCYRRQFHRFNRSALVCALLFHLLLDQSEALGNYRLLVVAFVDFIEVKL
jgi:hypothetical protein